MLRPLHVLFTLPLLLLPLLAQEPSKKLNADRAKGAATMTVEDLKTWLDKLTSPEFGGRGTGQEGFKLAAEMVRDHFQSLGLEPAGDNGTYWQKVPWGDTRIDKAATKLTFGKDGKEVLMVPCERLGGSVSVTTKNSGPVTLLIVAAPAGDLTVEIPGLDALYLKSHVVLLHVQGDGADAALRSQAISKLSGKEAAGVVLLESAPVAGGVAVNSGAGRGAGRARAGRRMMPAQASMGGDDAKTLLAAAGLDEKRLSGEPGAVPTTLTAKVELVVDPGDAPSWNVTGILRGSDAKLQSEYVVIGSHLDHLGRRGERYSPGADDDGSGSVGVLAVSRAFAKNPTRPRRSILFVTFCGEEAGLVGSSWFVDHSPIPLEAIAGELQMDMIGRNEQKPGEKAEDNLNSVHLIGTQRISHDLHELCLKKNETAGFALEWDEENVFSRSDHANFARKGIPIAFFFTGFHPDYHKESDTVEKIDFPKLLRIATWVYDIGFELAQQDGRPLVDPELWQKNRGSVQGVAVPVAPMRPEKAEKNDK